MEAWAAVKRRFGPRAEEARKRSETMDALLKRKERTFARAEPGEAADKAKSPAPDFRQQLGRAAKTRAPDAPGAIEEARAAARPEVSGKPAKSAPEREKAKEAPAESSYTSRLLEAKRRAQARKDQPPDKPV